MKNNEKIVLTPEGLEKLKKELKTRKTVKKPKLIDTIEELRNDGDLSENAGYHLALEERDSNDKRIEELERMIENAKVVDSCDNPGICIGSQITVLVNEKTEKNLHIVGDAEADPTENKISYQSPIGKALLEKKKGDTVEVDIPKGKVKYKILKIKNK